MFSDVPADLILFAVAVLGFFAIGLPLITRRVSVPRRVEFEHISESSLSPEQTTYFAELDAKLLELNYRPAANTRPTNMQGRAVIRLYFSEGDPASISMNLMVSEVSAGREHPLNYLEVMTVYQDRSILSTRNAEISDVLDPLPGHTIQERRSLREPAALKKAHDAAAESLRVRGPIFMRFEDYEGAFHDFHERWCRHQRDRGLLVPVKGGEDRLRPTVKAGVKGIINFLNPFADNFTPLRCVLAVVFGLVVPAAAVIWLQGGGAPLVDWLAANTGLAAEQSLIVLCAATFGLSGLVVGLVFVTKAFIWSFLLTYFLWRLAGPAGIWVTVAMSIWSGVAADLGARFEERRHRLA